MAVHSTACHGILENKHRNKTYIKILRSEEIYFRYGRESKCGGKSIPHLCITAVKFSADPHGNQVAFIHDAISENQDFL